MSRLVLVCALFSLTIVGCSEKLSSHEKALKVWESNLALAETLVASGDASQELQDIDAFFRRVTGHGGLIMPHTFDNITVSRHAGPTLRLLREWCDKNCDRLTLDPDTGEVIVLAEESGL